MRSSLITTMLCILSGLILFHCAGETPDQREITELLPAGDKLNGWKTVGPLHLYRGKDLFVYMNGGAEEYLSLGFKQLLSQKYSNENNKTITLELFEMENSTGALKMYGLKTGDGGRQVAMGNEGLLEEYYLNFRKDNFLVTLTGFDSEKETIDGLLAIGGGVDGKL